MKEKRQRMKRLLLLFLTAVLAAASPAYARPGAAYDRREALWYGTGTTSASAGASSKADKYAWQKINGVCYNGVGEKIPGAITRGIDVSEWQEEIDWEEVRNSNVDFAFIRVSYGRRKIDNDFDYNMKNAIRAGIPVGVYVYSLASTPEEAMREAQLCIRKLNGYKISYPVVFDMEDAAQAGLSKSKAADLAIAFCGEIRKAGYYPMVYTNTYWYTTHLDMEKLQNYDVWLACYNDTLTGPDKSRFRYGIWQATDGNSGSLRSTKELIRGIHKDDFVDINFGYTDYTKLITPRTSPVSSYVPSAVPESPLRGWVEENGYTYYYADGKLVKGARTISGKSYRFSASDGHLYKNVLLYSKTTGKTVYAGDDGALVKSAWVTTGGKTYYFGKDGAAYTGSRNIAGKYYLFNSKKGYLYTNLKKQNAAGYVYYYGSDGAKVTTGFTKISENEEIHTYYFSLSGLCYKGWHTIRGKQYYFYGGNSRRTGIRAENCTLRLSGMLCTFDENGVCTEKIPAE